MKNFSLFFCLSLFLIGFSVNACTQDATINTNAVLFEIQSGDNLTSIAKRLADQNIIGDATRFKIVAKLSGKDRSIQAGVYQIKPGESFDAVVVKFSKGDTFSLKITIPEGFNMFQIAGLLETNKICSKEEFLKECKNPELLTKYSIPTNASLEGYLYPDTYFIPLKFSAKQTIQMMLNQFEKMVDNDIRKKIQETGWTLSQVLTLASIIEKEAQAEFERPIISGVYHNRIRAKWKLQADPTIIYFLMLEGRYDGDIRFKDLEYKSPYNTYVVDGLPPTPIANPSRASILAALYPAQVEYMFFVAKRDGTHYFSVTLAEHNKAVAEYQKRH